ncbi:hypothetical protein MMC09_001128 [Bachmanniomyces sp. S44760]|nr:hypothetical protein [Bachmanniomyces sp. S44760]
MACSGRAMRPLNLCRPLIPKKSQNEARMQWLSTAAAAPGFTPSPPPPRRVPPGVHQSNIITVNRIKTYPPPPSARARCPNAIAALTASQLTTLDPTSSRTRLFSRKNPDAAKVGDILLVRFKSGDPYSGVCLNIRRQGIDTAILLRAQMTRVGVELWVKVYSPNVVGIEVVQRVVKRARRARLYYMRKPKHDRGNIGNIVDQYLRTRSLLRSGDAKGRGANAGKKKSKSGR